MPQKTIIYVPGKNPKPPAEQHRALLWRTLLEGVRRAAPQQLAAFEQQVRFELVAWNHLYYQQDKDITRDLPWIDRLIHTHGPSDEDIRQARHCHRKIDRLLYHLGDLFPVIIRLLPRHLRRSAEELNRYFVNTDDIACQIRELLKSILREAFGRGDHILLIGHSMGSVIAYDSLWELDHLEKQKARLSLLTLGSPLGMRYVQRRLIGHDLSPARQYPRNIRNWHNLSAIGDLVALDQEVFDDFINMFDYSDIESIQDHCHGIYNYFRNEEGLNCHRSYGYLVNPAVGELIARWWRAA